MDYFTPMDDFANIPNIGIFSQMIAFCLIALMMLFIILFVILISLILTKLPVYILFGIETSILTISVIYGDKDHLDIILLLISLTYTYLCCKFLV
jgi:hypothetical protein